MSYVVCGCVRHRVCGRWAKVEIPEKPHYVLVSIDTHAERMEFLHQFPISSRARQDAPV